MTTPTCEKILPCPNCDCEETFVADRCNFVMCAKCRMTGPVGHFEEEAVALWNRLPRRNPPDIKVTQDRIPDGMKGNL